MPRIRPSAEARETVADPATMSGLDAAVASDPSLSPVLRVLEWAAGELALGLFGPSLQDVRLTVTAHPRRTRREPLAAYREAQWDRGTLVAAEMNLAADGLARPAAEILLDLARMLVRVRGDQLLQAGQFDRAVASRQGRYCNKRYRKVAAEAGLEPPPECSPRDGWGQVTWGPTGSRSRAVLDGVLSRVASALGLVRRPPQPQPPATVRWECACDPPVGFRHRRRDLRIRCEACGRRFRIVRDEGEEIAAEGSGRAGYGSRVVRERVRGSAARTAARKA